jgi:hypothetical protein
MGVVNVDAEKSPPEALDSAVSTIRRVSAIREAWVIHL